MEDIISNDTCLLDFSIWNNIREVFFKEFGKNNYEAWLSNIDPVSLTKSEIVMSVPNNFIRDWVKRYFLNGLYKKSVCVKKGIKQILLDFYPDLKSFEFIIDSNENKKEKKQQIQKVERNNNITSISEHGNLYNIGTELNNKYSFENFIIGDSNKLAFQVAKNFSESNNYNSDINPLFIYGNVGLGKTHLCQAIAWKMKEINPNKNIVYLSAEKFMFLFVQALHNQDINDFKNRFRNIDTLIVDDIQFITGKDKTQQEFFYTFDTLVNDKKNIVLACDRSPKNLENLDEKLKSRMNGGFIVDIKDPDYQLRFKFIKEKSINFNLDLNEYLQEFLAINLNLSIREIEGCLKRLYITKSIQNINIDKEVIETVLSENMDKKVYTIEKIQEVTSKFFDISLNDLKSDKRLKNLVLPRHVAMFLSKKLTNKSYPDIAKKFNHKNHATVIYACKKISEITEEDSEISKTVSDIEKSL